MLLSSLVLALVSAAPVTATAPQPATKDGTVDGIALPLLSFNSDFGMAYGVVGGMHLYGEGREPYEHGLGAQVFFSP